MDIGFYMKNHYCNIMPCPVQDEDGVKREVIHDQQFNLLRWVDNNPLYPKLYVVLGRYL